MADLLTPILDNGILSTNFFNGRLLMAGDLRTEQTANRQQHQELGRAAGDGVVYGFVVQSVTGTPAPPQTTVSVTAGLGITRSGRAVLLPQNVQLALVASNSSGTPGLDLCGRDALFQECGLNSTASTGNPGLYILTVSPTSGLSSDLAPMAELGSNGIGTSCASKYSVEGVQFRLVSFTPSGAAGSLRDQLAALARQNGLSGAGLFKLRNGLAHACYGTDLLGGFAQAPFGASQGGAQFVSFGLIDDLRGQKLISDCEIPLALIYWTTAGIQFIDAWSARRRMAPRLLDDFWPLPLDARRLGDAEAAFLQFEDQITALASEPSSAKIMASSYFYYLPAAGFLPPTANQYQNSLFFSGFKLVEMTTDASEIRLLLRESLYMDPIDPANPPTVRLYRVNGTEGYLLFMRKPNWKRFSLVPEGLGAITVEILARPVPATAPGPVSIQITAQSLSSKNKRIFATFAGTTHREKVGGEEVLYVYDLGNLPFDTYSVSVTAAGYYPSVPQTQAVDAQRATLKFTLTRRSQKQGAKPAKSIGAAWVQPGWYGKVYMVESQRKATWPPADAPKVSWLDAGDPPAEAQQWLLEWARQGASANPAARNTTAARIMRDPAHTPSVTYDQPYAYAVFNNGGGSVPVLLTAANQTLEHATSAAKAQVPGIDPVQDAASLQSFGIGETDALGAAYKSLVAHALGVSSGTAGAIIGSAQQTAAAFAGSVRMFSGVDAATAAALKDLNITTAVDLANADPDKLVSDTISAAAAQRMVEEARNAVPKEAWSLSSAAVGLSQAAQDALTKLGVTTLGGFRAAATGDGTKDAVIRALAVSADLVAKAVSQVDLQRQVVLTGRKSGAPASSLFGVGSATAVELAGAGLGTTGALAAADPAAVAKLFGGDVARATDVVTAAKAFIAG